MPVFFYVMYSNYQTKTTILAKTPFSPSSKLRTNSKHVLVIYAAILNWRVCMDQCEFKYMAIQYVVKSVQLLSTLKWFKFDGSWQELGFDLYIVSALVLVRQEYECSETSRTNSHLAILILVLLTELYLKRLKHFDVACYAGYLRRFERRSFIWGRLFKGGLLLTLG
jgi:hypothetical protein